MQSTVERSVHLLLLCAALSGCGGGGGSGGAADGGGNQPSAGTTNPPTIVLSANPSEIGAGETTLLSWTTSGATACAASGAWSGAQPLNGTFRTETLATTQTFTLSCDGAGGNAVSNLTVDVVAPVDPAPTLQFTASPTQVAMQGSSQLSWSTTNASNCTATGAWSGARSTSGQESTGTLTGSGEFTLSCDGPGGSVTRAVTVTVEPDTNPTLSFTATPASVQPQGSSELSWSTTGATSCTASGAWSGTRATSGTAQTGALAASQRYTLTCTGTGGTVTETANVTVGQVSGPAAPALTFSATPGTVAPQGSAQLSWSASHATSCTASGAWSGSRSLSGNQSTGPLAATGTYTLTCTGAGGSVAKSATVSVTAPPPTLTFTANPAAVAAQGSSQLNWSTTNASGCTASGGWSGAKPTDGNHSTGALAASSSYTLTCNGSGGTVARTATVTVEEAKDPTVSFSAAARSVPASGTTTLTWSTTGADTCAATGGWSGSKATSGSATVGPLAQDTTYTLTCSAGDKTAVAMTTIVIRQARLSWQAPTRNVDGSTLTNLAGYTVHYGTSSRNYGQTVAIGNKTTLSTVVVLSPGTWHFAVTARNAEGKESAFSNEVVKTVP